MPECPNFGRYVKKFWEIDQNYVIFLRIPTIAATHSDAKRPPIPKESGHLSERSDAGGSIVYEFIPDGSSGVKFCAFFFLMDSPLRVMV